MSDIFCEERIIAVYDGDQEDLDGANAYFDIFRDIAYHTTEGHRIILETESFYISLGHSGVIKQEKGASLEEIALDGECIGLFSFDLEEGREPWIDYEVTLFVGERLLDVQKKDGTYLLTFDDFQMKLIPYELGADMPPSLSQLPRQYYHVYGAERHLKKRCSCGGAGELLCDYEVDFFVRCKKCKKSTYADTTADRAIKDWNKGRLKCDLSEITIDGEP